MNPENKKESACCENCANSGYNQDILYLQCFMRGISIGKPKETICDKYERKDGEQ